MQRHRIILIMSALAAVLAAGCKQEKEVVIPGVGDNDIAFKSSRIMTRSAATADETAMTGTTSTAIKGYDLVLEESITDLESGYYEAPATRGTPSYSENVASLYGSFTANIYNAATGTNAFGDAEFAYKPDGETWVHHFYESPWRSDPDALYFFLRMPGQMDGVTFGSDAYNVGTGSITFGYTSPLKAEDQKDILFTSRKMTQKEYSDEVKNNGGASLLFHHALTGVKFANYYSNDGDTHTIITGIAFEGLYDKGTCTVTPRQEGGAYIDESEYSSSDGTTVVWKDLERTGSKLTAEFGDDFAEYDSSLLPEAFTGSNTTRNLNDAKATQTFWLVPQAISEEVKVKVTFKLVYKDGTESEQPIELTLNLGELLSEKSIEWKAGQLRTYTLKPNEVNVVITDKMNDHTKSDVVIFNTGNVDQFVRATVVASWVDEDGNLVFGYNEDGTDFAQWELTADGKGANYGTFTNLGTNAGWSYNTSDGYYYFSEAIGPAKSTTTPLFDKYTVTDQTIKMVKYYENGEPVTYSVTVHLVMDIIVQAIETGGETDYTAAWAKAKPGEIN